MVEPRSECCERGCKRGMLLLRVAYIVVVHVVLTLGQRRTGGTALNNTCVCWVIHR